MKYKVGCTWEVCGEFEIEANDKKDFLDKIHELQHNSEHICLPTDSEYIDGSFEISGDYVQLSLNNLE